MFDVPFVEEEMAKVVGLVLTLAGVVCLCTCVGRESGGGREGAMSAGVWGRLRPLLPKITDRKAPRLPLHKLQEMPYVCE
jgi:hypothetical protein